MTNSELPVSGPGTCARFSAPKPVGPRAAGVVEREVEGCFALLCADGDRVLVLNETASDLWRLIDGDLTLDVIVDLLSHAYGVEPRLIYNDVERTVNLLRDNGLLSVAD